MTYAELTTFITTSFGYQSLSSVLSTYMQFGVDMLDAMYHGSQVHGDKIHPVEVAASQKIIVVPDLLKANKILLYAESPDQVVYEGVELKYVSSNLLRSWIIDSSLLLESSYTIPTHWSEAALLLKDSMIGVEADDYAGIYSYGEDYIVFSDDDNYSVGLKGIVLYPSPSAAITLHIHGRFKSGSITEDTNEWIALHPELAAFATKYFVETMYYSDVRRGLETLGVINNLLDNLAVKELTLIKGPKKVGG
jgi:hypothetical protein